MADTRFMKGNEALGEAAIRSGLQAYFGYPITPQSEVVEYLAMQEPNHNYVLIQAESEVASVNMVYGAAAAGARVMTTTSSPGFSLMQEGVSYIACAELPCVFANITRGGPGLGTIQPSQSDYFQAVKGGGHGDYHLIVLAPNSVQEMV
ncbi:MAG: 3-methyl-2-oxobutanoate dehydrogenase subunit VorB, partial [Candidatus Aminicenantes bacterium]|nr:3-methyl-2-oxobutanoate dehydrogenase subunit VorB [Candidatus Aminicenantes bacterium]